MKNITKKSIAVLLLITVFVSIQVNGMSSLSHNEKNESLKTSIEVFHVDEDQIQLLKLEKVRYQSKLKQLEEKHQQNIDKILQPETAITLEG